jgi:hypothetical protein
VLRGLTKTVTDCYSYAMGRLISAEDGAIKLGITSGRIRTLCRQRRIKGARCIAGRWFVPEVFTVSPGTRGPKLRK